MPIKISMLFLMKLEKNIKTHLEVQMAKATQAERTQLECMTSSHIPELCSQKHHDGGTKQTIGQQNSTEDPEVNPYSYSKLIFA